MCFRPPEMKKPIICPACGIRNPGINKKCKKCAADLPEEMIPCPHCGVQQSVDNKICKNCGFNGKPGSGNPEKQKQ